MSDTFCLQDRKLYFPALFTPTDPFQEDRPMFRAAAEVGEDTLVPLPSWVPFREATISGKSAYTVNFASFYRIPIFGLPAEWLEFAERTNFDKDRLLMLTRPVVSVHFARSSRRDRTGQRNYADPICIEIKSIGALPTPEDIVGFSFGGKAGP